MYLWKSGTVTASHYIVIEVDGDKLSTSISRPKTDIAVSKVETRKVRNLKPERQEAQLSQRDRAAACLNFGKNISANSVHLTLLYVTALTSTNHHFTVLWHHLCT